MVRLHPLGPRFAPRQNPRLELWFTGTAKADAAKLAGANAALIGDIALGLNTKGTNLINDEGQVQLDFNALNTDLGLPLPT